jgi:hypothetical protein
MPDKEDTQQFIDDKEWIINSIDELMDHLQDCERLGMLDENSEIYNKLILLKENTDASDSYFLLSEIVYQAKLIEKNIDAWLASMGRYTDDLSWPDISLNS